MAKRHYSDEQLLAVLERLLAGDPTASAELAEAVFYELVERLERFSRATAEEATDAVSLAIVNFLKHPTAYDRAKCKLRTYLHNAAVRDLLNEREKARRVAARERPVERVEVYEGGRNRLVAAGGRLDANRPDWLFQVNEAWRLVEHEFPDPRDREVIELMLAGERATKSYAQALDLGTLPPERQRELVKRHKDRIQKRLRRLRERYSDER